jgi:hypothetical protein
MPLRSPEYWRRRAADARAAARDMRNDEARVAMLAIASMFDRLDEASGQFEAKFGRPEEGWADDKP